MAEYDVFLSYKTENANAAREVAECLAANGLRVWFAEYRITLGIYDDIGAIKAAISDGIDSSSHALVFTNDRWAGSEYCRFEMERIVARFGQSSALEVRIPDQSRPREVWPVLDTLPWVIHERGPGHVLAAINQLGWFRQTLELRTVRYPAPTAERWMNLRFGIRFPSGPFRERDEPYLILEHGRRSFPGERYYLKGEIDSRRVLVLVTVNPYQSPLRGLAVAEDGDTDDWAVHKSYRGFAGDWLRGQDRAERGVHLFFRDNRSHLAITSSENQVRDGARDWERRYAVMLRDPSGGDAGELNIAFNLQLDAGDDRAAFETFCRYTPLFDSIVGSVAYTPDRRLASGESVRVIAAKAVLAVLAWGVWDLLRSTSAAAPARTAAVLLAGAFTMSLAVALQSHRSRRDTEVRGLSVGPRIRIFPFALIGRLADQLWNVTAGAFLSCLSMVLQALADPAVLIVGGAGIWQRYSSPWFWGLLGAWMYVIGETSGRISSEERRPWT